jgi:hypothetical protein
MRLLLAVTALLIAAPIVLANASHEGWPEIDNFEKNESDLDKTTTGTRENDELLGGHGDDVILGLEDSDVLWGDYKPCCQPAGQHDRLEGGDGDDFLYASHGHNRIEGGNGSDVIHALYGKGRIDCGPGRDAVYVPKPRKRYRYRHCEWKKHQTGHSAPKWWLRRH